LVCSSSTSCAISTIITTTSVKWWVLIQNLAWSWLTIVRLRIGLLSSRILLIVVCLIWIPSIILDYGIAHLIIHSLICLLVTWELFNKL
jgi:hypothetical protein